MSALRVCCGTLVCLVGATLVSVPLGSLVAERGVTHPLAPAGSSTAGSPDDLVQQVVVISVDGLNPAAIRKLRRDGTPAVHKMMRRGAWTLNARTEVGLTTTLPNHTGMLTGRRIEGTRGHHVDLNTDPGGSIHRRAGHYVSSVFDVVHNHGGSTRLYAMKDKFVLFDRSWNARHGAPDRSGANDGRDKIDHFVIGSADKLTDTLVRRLRRSPDRLSFLHLAHPDVAGHKHGFMSAAYLRAVRRADHQVGRILRSVQASPRLRRHTTVILTADHGGRGSHHANPASRHNYTVPFLVWGASVARGRGLYSLNPDRLRPSTGRPGNSGKQPVRNAEVANLVSDLLDIPRVPGSKFDRAMDLDVHGPPPDGARLPSAARCFVNSSVSQ